MSSVIDWVKQPTTRKFLYRVAWAALLLAVAQGKIAQDFADQILVAAAALFGIADYNTGDAPSPTGETVVQFVPVQPVPEPSPTEEPTLTAEPLPTPADVDVDTWLPTK